MQNVSRPLIFGGALAFLFAAVFLSGNDQSNLWMAFFILSGLVIILTIYGTSKQNTDNSSNGSTAGVINFTNVGETEKLDSQKNKQLPDPLDEGFDLPL